MFPRPRPFLAAVLLASPAFAQTQPAREIIGPLPPEGPLVITILEFNGAVSVRDSADAPWRKPEANTTLPEGAEVRTGVRSFIKLKIGDDQVTTLDRLSTYKLLKANFESGVFTTDVAVKYGRMKYEIETAGRVHDATVRSATSTLAVRGTVFEIYDQPPFTQQAVSYTGRVMVRDIRKQISIGGKGSTKVVVDGDRDSAVATAMATASFDPLFDIARTDAEQRLIEQVVATGGIISFDQPNGIPIVRGGTPLQFTENSTNFPGAGLNFILNWTGDADLNLSVFQPKFADFTTPLTGLNRGNTGGITAFDHRGGANGGFEIVFYPQNYPGSTATAPPGGFATIPGPSVTDPVSGITRPTIQILNGAEIQGGETYVTQVEFVSGAGATYSLQTYALDPQTGKQVLVAGTFGDLSRNSNGQVNATKTDVTYNPPPTQPNPNDGARVQSLSAKTRKPRPEFQTQPTAAPPVDARPAKKKRKS